MPPPDTLPSSLLPRSHIKKAHNGRETRGVYKKTSAKAVGFSWRSILGFFLGSLLLFLVPLLAGFPFLSGNSTAVDSLSVFGLTFSAYVCWIPTCSFILHRTRSNAFNALRHQTFDIPWRFRRDHASQVRLDRLKRAWPGPVASQNSTKTAFFSRFFTIFVDVPGTGTLALTVTPSTTISDIREAICHRGYAPCHSRGPMYLMGRWRPLGESDSMAALGVGNSRHFLLPPRVLGGADEVGVNEHGWEQCALNPDGSSKDESQIKFFFDKDDEEPLNPPPPQGTQPQHGSEAGPSGRPQRGSNTKMKAIMEALSSDDDARGDAEARRARGTKRKAGKKKGSKDAKGKQKAVDSDEETEYIGSSDSNLSDSDSGVQVTNEELIDTLTTKTIPKGAPRSGKPSKKKARKSTDAHRSRMPSSPLQPQQRTPRTTTTNPIYHFFENITNKAHGQKAIKGDKFFKCFHGESPKKVLKITAAMHASLNGLTGHLKNVSPEMFRFYEILKDRKTPVTPEEADIASGRKTFAKREDLLAYLDKVASATTLNQQTIREAFARAQEMKIGPWDQATFKRLLVEWLVACDQPFSEVERPEFQDLLHYVHHREPALEIPSGRTVKRRVDDMLPDLVRELKSFFAVTLLIPSIALPSFTNFHLQSLEAQVSISLDAWSSSNGYAFMAIVAHYVTNEGKLDTQLRSEELLIDFVELIGEHSGENMAEVVWESLDRYGLIGRVMAFMMDNASNNDTLAAAFERRCNEAGIRFSASDSRLRCMPHTIHLAVLQLLEAIGAVEKDSRAKKSKATPYQDVVSASPESDELNGAAVGIDDDEDEEEPTTAASEPIPAGIKGSVKKLRKVIRSVRSSPQRRRGWYELLSLAPRRIVLGTHMLILDVKTRWSSTHQMMKRAITYRDAIGRFINNNSDLHSSELTVQDWTAIETVADWLQTFRAATTEMSRTSRPMLSSTHSTFRGLQKILKEKIASLPPNASPELREGLAKAHLKLSDYYYKYDQSPFYIWAALLDPRFNLKKLQKDYANDPELKSYLEVQTAALRRYFEDHYPASTSTASAAPSGGNLVSSRSGSSFAALDQGTDDEEEADELERYFEAPRPASSTT
ncbi:ribonuclease H-like domain-containing protein [Favolaschia claudopus]|uniref:Ribonuclease H-like domain-containing protein n=1 Tax=Favolaschia claudopus TaxID=2862362 RepID=A0AAV9ZHY6_9AGAR